MALRPSRCCSRLLLCIFAPCILLACIFVYVLLALCLALSSSLAPRPRPLLADRFVAAGAVRTGALAPHPTQSFWVPEGEQQALWNRLQQLVDRQHNPILRPQAEGRLGDTGGLWGCRAAEGAVGAVGVARMPPQLQDFVKAMHCRQYMPLLSQPALCETRPFLLLAIKTQSHHFPSRQAIRRTWGRAGSVRGQAGAGGVVRRVFLLGRYSLEQNLLDDELLPLESRRYGDILQWDFLDTFFNLTLKDVLFWHWISQHCHQARFVFKGDDDVFVRTPALLDYLQEERMTRNGSLHDFIAGDVIRSATPIRNSSTKYFIPKAFYEGLYPSYAGGGGVVYSGALALRLRGVSDRVHLFPIDDVYVGMCLQRLGVLPTHHPAFLTFDFPKHEANRPCAHHTVLLVHKRSPGQILHLWAESRAPPAACRNATLRTQPHISTLS